MFLFKRKKEDNDSKTAEPTSAQLLRPDKSKKDNPEKVKGKTIEAESVVETIEKTVAQAQDSPVKVVVPASALKEDVEESIPVAAVTPPVAPIPDEGVDSLLTPGHQAAAAPTETKAAAPPPPAPVAAKPADPPPVSPKADDRKAVKEGEGKENMFSSIFGKAIEVEENSLGRLIKDLPEISMEEVLNEAEEVNNLIREFS